MQWRHKKNDKRQDTIRSPVRPPVNSYRSLPLGARRFNKCCRINPPGEHRCALGSINLDPRNNHNTLSSTRKYVAAQELPSLATATCRRLLSNLRNISLRNLSHPPIS